jgi:predicted ATPase/DNA-binding SARP family transcriptional activator
MGLEEFESQPALYLLGTPYLSVHGESIRIDTRKAIALLAYLITSGEGYTRDGLAAFFWPDYTQSKARAALRRTLSVLNRALGRAALLASRENIDLDVDHPIWCDAKQFLGFLDSCAEHGHSIGDVCEECISPLERAVALYRGDFMAGFSLRDSVAFDDWQFFEGEALRQKLGGALEGLVIACSAKAEFKQALEYARRWLALDPLREEAHRQIMQCFAWAGQRSAALHQYEECKRILWQELGVSPLPETSRLFEGIKANQLPETPKLWRREAAQVAIAPPLSRVGQFAASEETNLVGREQEWQALLLGLQAAANGKGWFIALQGEAGIGKTRLARDFAFYARQQGSIVLWASCFQGEANLAYGPFLEIFQTALRSPDAQNRLGSLAPQLLSEASRLLPEVVTLAGGVPSPAANDSPGAQTRFLDALRQILFALMQGPAPGVIVIDDLHWADEATLDLLTFVIRRLRDQPVLLLAAWRAEGKSGEGRLDTLLADALRSGVGQRLSLSRLTAANIAEWLTVNFRADQDRLIAWSERLYAETDGSPFLLVEYLKSIPEELPGLQTVDWSLPAGVRELLHWRLSGLDEASRQVIQAAAAIGRFFDYKTLHAASGRSEEETVMALETLIQRGIIREAQLSLRPVAAEDLLDLRYDFDLDKERMLVYEETSMARRRLLHRRIAAFLVEHMYGREERLLPAARLAYHFRLAGMPQEAANFLKAAGEDARAVYANQEALAHFQTALALGHPDTAWLNEAIGDLQIRLGIYAAALASYRTAETFIDPCCEDFARIELKVATLYQRLGDWEQAEESFRSAVEAARQDGGGGQPHTGLQSADLHSADLHSADLQSVDLQSADLHSADLQSQIYAHWSHTAHLQGQAERALDLARRALGLAELVENEQALAQAYNILGILYRGQGNLQKAAQQVNMSLEIAAKIGDVALQMAALNNLALVHADQEDLRQAVDDTLRALELCRLQGDRHREAALYNNLADFYHGLGDKKTSQQYQLQAVTIFAEIGKQSGSQRPEIWKLTEW